MKDYRSYEIKKLLKTNFPQGNFRVYIHKYSMGESINVRTDLIKDVYRRCEDCQKDFTNGYVFCPTHPKYEMRLINPTPGVSENIKKILREYENVDRDEATGEILSGGNTYLFVESL